MRIQFHFDYLPLVLLSLLLLPADNCGATESTLETTSISFTKINAPYSISADGRYVAFSNVDPIRDDSDFNRLPDVFVYDRQTGTYSRVSVDSAGGQGHGASGDGGAISADGRIVTFASEADNLVAGDTNAASDIFTHDRTTGKTIRVSIASASPGEPEQRIKQGNGYSGWPSISADGRYVAFSSGATNLVLKDTNDSSDIFVHDLKTGITTRASVDSAEEEVHGYSGEPAISSDGRFVAFTSIAANLVLGDFNKKTDVFVHDRTSGATTRISVDSAGGEGNNNSFGPSISADGRYVAFSSAAENLVPGDSNKKIDTFVHDRVTGLTTRAPVLGGGVISADGVYVASPGYILYNRITGKINYGIGDKVTSDRAKSIAISADGRHVSFTTYRDFVPFFVRDRRLDRSQNANLQVAVTSQPDTVQNDQVARYIFTISNKGPENIAEGIKLIDIVSEGKVWSLTPSQGDCIIAALSVCRLGALAAGESMTVRAVFKAQGNPMTQQVSVSAPPLDNIPDNNTVRVSTQVTP